MEVPQVSEVVPASIRGKLLDGIADFFGEPDWATFRAEIKEKGTWEEGKTNWVNLGLMEISDTDYVERAVLRAASGDDLIAHVNGVMIVSVPIVTDEEGVLATENLTQIHHTIFDETECKVFIKTYPDDDAYLVFYHETSDIITYAL